MSKTIKYCKAWVESTNARCLKKAAWGTNYCWLHYPKKEMVIFNIFFAALGVLLSLFFSEPLIQTLSKFPIFHYLDRNKPVITRIIPNIMTSQQVNKETKEIDVLFYDKDSGIDLSKSEIKLSYKGDKEYELLGTKIDKTASKLSLIVNNGLINGEYLFDVLLVDKAKNTEQLTQSFTVREQEELEVSVVSYEHFESSPYKNIFNDFFETNKGLVSQYDFYIYELLLHNKEHIAKLRDLYLMVRISGGVIFYWQQVKNFRVPNEVNIINTAESMNRMIPKGKVYLSESLLDIKEIGPGGILSFAILIGEDIRIDSSKGIWKGISIDGTYQSDGYGVSQNRRVDWSFAVENEMSKTKTMGVIFNNLRKGDNIDNIMIRAPRAP